MNKFIIILITSITLISCNTTLHKVDDPENLMTVEAQKSVAKDTTTFKIYHYSNNADVDKFDVYSTDNILVYKSCASGYKNDVTNHTVGFTIAMFIFGVFIGFVVCFISTCD